MRRMVALISLVLLVAGCGGDDSTDTAGTTTAVPEVSGPLAAADLAGVKTYLTDHTVKLVGFTERFRSLADDYDELAGSVAYDHARLLREHRAQVEPILAQAKDLWTEGNPYYERVEGVVAGTPSLAVYDVILDAGSSAAEDPASAVPFDLKLADGRVLAQAGQPLQPDRGHALGHASRVRGRRSADLDARRHGSSSARCCRTRTSSRRPPTRSSSTPASSTASARAWKPTASDAFTSVVVMVPTMSEYFGQWKVSRFVLGREARRATRSTSSPGSPTSATSSAACASSTPASPRDRARSTRSRRAQTKRSSTRSWRSSATLAGAGARRASASRPQQADVLGRRRRSAATAIAGQVTQAAARLKVKIVAVAVRTRALLATVLGGLPARRPARRRAAAGRGRPRSTSGAPFGAARPRCVLGDEPRAAQVRVVGARPLELVLARPAAAPGLRSGASPRRPARGERAGARRCQARRSGRPCSAPALSRRPRPHARGDVASGAASWLLVREFRPPTRFTRARRDATLAARALAQRRHRSRRRRDRRPETTCSTRTRPAARLARAARGQPVGADSTFASPSRQRWPRVLVDPRAAYAAQRGAAAARRPRRTLDVARASRRRPALESKRRSLRIAERALAGFRAAPLSGRGAAAARRPARPVPAARPDRVRARRRGRPGHARLRDPGGDHVPRRRRRRVPRPRADPARAATPRRRGGSTGALDSLGLTLDAASARAIASPSRRASSAHDRRGART